METQELERVADEFLRSADATYAECERGISTLDRVIVSVTASLAPATRAALLPTLYAYWERFFRIVFSEYVRCVGSTLIPAERFCESLLKFRLKGELGKLSRDLKISHVNELAARGTTSESCVRFQRLHQMFVRPLEFPEPTEWINTESNVSYKVLEKNCKNLGLSVSDIEGQLAPDGSLYVKLTSLVRSRNAIAHGENIGPLSSDEWEEHRTFVLNAMNAVQLVLYESMRKSEIVLRAP